MGPAFLKLRGDVRYRLEDIESFERQTLQSATGCNPVEAIKFRMDQSGLSQGA